MSQNSFITDADAALTSLIWDCIEKKPEARSLILSKEQISFSSPKASNVKGTRKLSIFLYSISEETTDASRKGTDHLSLALHYLVTPFTGNDKDDHVVLGMIIQALRASPRITGTDEKNKVELTVKVDSLSLEELTKLWTVLGSPLRPSVSLTVSSAKPGYDHQAKGASSPVASQTAAADIARVNQLYLAVLKTFTEQSNDWSKRNMAVKQWLLRDFKKNTDITVEEMQTALNNLGSKIEQHGSTAQSINHLNRLAGYYQHQLSELKGLHKITHGQRENIEMISAWIKEVEDLVDALGGNRQT